ncbi:DUF3313 domain-containing protein [Aquipseudomonas ullengensis]|uniref:DUF3313 domain-containing protein n=1 Tax=Aquipseudomonas ullengensis TaxID=2759166 RepID=A0A7W4QAE0_9GAMM|nr:DUF3313 domain-containing protein [Pseudomonas ullengensis]MBB2495737.1 DUF3313 domain-containing protein [Pseudomonas ullengensis]
MKRYALRTLGLSLSLLLAACSSQTTKPEQYSGFLKDYSQLQPATSASGVPVLRWVAPGLDLNNYPSVMVEKPVFFPKPQPSDQVSQKALDDIAVYLQQAMQRELAGRMQVVDQPNQDTLVLRTAITAVDVSAEGLKFYEVIPIALVAAAASTAIGTRDRDTDIYVEMEALDARTSQPVAKIVRKGHGLDLENKSTQLTVNDLKPALDSWAKDARTFKP